MFPKPCDRQQYVYSRHLLGCSGFVGFTFMSLWPLANGKLPWLVVKAFTSEKCWHLSSLLMLLACSLVLHYSSHLCALQTAFSCGGRALHIVGSRQSSQGVHPKLMSLSLIPQATASSGHFHTCFCKHGHKRAAPLHVNDRTWSSFVLASSQCSDAGRVGSRDYSKHRVTDWLQALPAQIGAPSAGARSWCKARAVSSDARASLAS